MERGRMRIRNQIWIDTQTHLVLALHEPYWSGWKKYGWEKGVPGLGISVEAIEKAQELGKKIRVNVLKYGSYEITPTKAQQYNTNKFVPRDMRPILVIPRTAFDSIPVEKTVKEMEKKDEVRSQTIAKAEQKKLF